MARRFFWLWLAEGLGLLALTALVNVIVDPYGIYGWVNVVGFNWNKTQAVDESRMAKVYMVDRAHAATLLIGSSRIEAGLDPESPVWPQDLRPVFNLGIPGTDPYAQLRFLQEGLALTQPKLVVIGTDFVEALTSASDLAASSQMRGSLNFEKRLWVTEDGTPNGEMRLARARDFAKTLLSLSALGDSIATVLSQHDLMHRRLTAFGFNTATNFYDLVRTEGAYSLFVAKDRQRISEVVPPPTQPRFDLQPIGNAIREARAHGAQVIVMITPSHADELEIYRQAGIMDLYEAWMLRLTEVVAAASDDKVTLWNFAGLTPYTTEAVPLRSDKRTQLRWFWETDHFEPALGNLIISRILGQGPQGFGDQLTLPSVRHAVAELRAQLKHYEETNSAGVERISQLITERLDYICHNDPSSCSRVIADADQRIITVPSSWNQ